MEVPSDYTDFLLIQDLYHCTPEELDRQDDYVVGLHIEFLNAQAEKDELERKREEQKAKMAAKKR